MTHLSDGKYLTLDELKLYGIGAIADPSNTTVYNSAVQGTPDDAVLSQCIHRAEFEIDRIAGIQFDQQTRTLVNAFTPFVDGNGWLHLFARENCPVTAVTAVQVRTLAGTNRAWQAITLSADDIILPMSDGYAHPDSAHVKVYAGSTLAATPTGHIQARWTYTGGFSSIPKAFKAMVSRMAWWIYKLREAPVNAVTMPNLGIMQVPLRIPPDIDADIRLWQPMYS